MALRKPFSRWTADTERAFLIALQLHGNVRLAATAIGRALATAYSRRRRNAEFRERWDAVVAEHQDKWREAAQAGRAPEPPAARQRFDGWTVIRRRAFLRALSELGDVREACERVRISNTSAYRLRDNCPEFARDWDHALNRATPMLEQIAWERAVEGWDEPVVYGGQVVATRRRYSDALLRTLLLRDRDKSAARKGPPGPAELTRLAWEAARAAGGGFYTKATEEETDRAILRQLAVLDRRLKAKAAAEAEAAALADDR